MSKPAREPVPARAPEKPVAKSKSDSVLAGGFRAAGLCRTTNGWAAATVEIDADGKLVKVTLGPTQGFPEHVAQNMVKLQMGLNQETLKRYPWHPLGVVKAPA